MSALAFFRGMRAGVVLAVVVVLVGAGLAGAATRGSYWSVGKVLRKLDGARIHVGARSVRIRSETTLCAGEGVAIRRHGLRMWKRFSCTYTTFTNGGADRDIDFRLRVRDARHYTLYDAHWVTGTR